MRIEEILSLLRFWQKGLILLSFFLNYTDFASGFEEMSHPSFLLGEEWHGFELILPLLRDDHGILLHLLILNGVP